jgi:hypothetical protein
LHDPKLLADLIAEDCVIEDSGPAPAGARHVGRPACLARWSDHAHDRVRGLNLIRRGQIVGARGYVKA